MKTDSDESDTNNTAFVIMPISNPDNYDAGHFNRVYKHLIAPACEDAGFSPLRADEVKNTNYIILDIIRRIIESPIAICDLSNRNPNVLYELGIRQAFNLPVILIKDTKSERIFDIQGFRTLDYDESLRVDTIATDKKALAEMIKATIAKKEDLNSLIQLLGIQEAKISTTTQISPEIELILDSVRDLSRRMTGMEDTIIASKLNSSISVKGESPREYQLPTGELVRTGCELFKNDTKEHLGYLHSVNPLGVIISTKRNGTDNKMITGDSKMNITTIPF